MENVDVPAGEGEDISESDEEEGTPARFFLPKLPRNSFLRQVFCLSAVMALPYFSAITTCLGVDRFEDLPKYNRSVYIPIINQIEIQEKQTVCLGGIVGYIFSGIVWYLIGSKYLVVIANFLNLVLVAMAVYLHGVTDQRRTLYAIGFKNAFSHLAYFVYTAEISDNSFRAFFMGLHLMIDYGTRPNLNKLYLTEHLDSVYRIGLVVAIPFLVLSLIVPESPFSAALKGNRGKARAIFQWIRAEEVNEFEYEMMIEKADGIVQYRGIVSKIFSSTFATCVITGIITNLVLADNDCDLLTIISHDYYFSGAEHDEFLMEKVVDYFEEYADYKSHSIMFGCLIYQGLCFYAPRKKLYAIAIVLYFLHAVPMIVHAEFTAVQLIYPLCYAIPAMGITQTGNLLPIEVEVVWSYSPSLTKLTGRGRGGLETVYYPKYLRRNWTYSNIAATLIGVPFILIFVPETMDINLYELEDFSEPQTDESILPEEGSEYAITEEEKDDQT